MNEFSVQRRGDKGVKCYKIIGKTGDVIGAKVLNLENEVMLITNEGIIIRTLVSDISVVNTFGVKLINIDSEKGTRVASIAKVREPMNPENQEDLLKKMEAELEEELIEDDEELLGEEEVTEE